MLSPDKRKNRGSAFRQITLARVKVAVCSTYVSDALTAHYCRHNSSVVLKTTAN